MYDAQMPCLFIKSISDGSPLQEENQYHPKNTYIDGCRALVRINYSLVTPVQKQAQSDGY